MNKKMYFKLYANCLPVSGVNHATLCDLGSNSYCFIPIQLYELLEINKKFGFSLSELSAYYDGCCDEGIEKWFTYLESKGYGFYTQEPELFPELNLDWDSPYRLSNAIIEYDKDSVFSLENVLFQLNEIGCQAVEMWFIDDYDLDALGKVLSLFRDSRFKAFFIYLKYQDGIFPEKAANLFLNYRRILSLVFHSAPEEMNNIYPAKGHEFINNTIRATKSKLGRNMKDVISGSKLAINMDVFTESQHFHPGFNRKVAIDSRGFIKNYPSFIKSYGAIGDIGINEVLLNRDFRWIWNVKPDMIEECKQCCLRYVCVNNIEIYEHNGCFYKVNECDLKLDKVQ